MAKEYATKEEKKCVECGSEFIIKIYPDGRYMGGHYFGTISLPKGNGRYEKMEGRELVRWTGKKTKKEYWECNDCYKRNDRESWLEKMIEELYGERCPDKDPHCACCEAWELYDNVIEKGKEQIKDAKKRRKAGR